MRPPASLLPIALIAASSLSACISTAAAQQTDARSDRRSDERFFESRIRPVLHDHCYSCHSANSKIVRGGLLLDSRDGALRGGDSGPAVVPGDVSESLLVAAIQHESLEMPPKGKLPDAVIEDFVKWVEGGAFDPRTESAAPARLRIDPIAAAEHWAFQPIDRPTVPATKPLASGGESSWVKNAIDAFILDRLAEKGWQPAPRADKYTLIRRATFDLIGLPPSEQEIAAFLADRRPGSFARVVDRLLASPYYGQRWGRHWLDLVRYADSNGADENHTMPNAWRYRDWVFKTLNRDLPLNEFIVQQLAGDLLPAPDSDEHAADLLTATGMLVLGPKMLAEQDKEKMQIDIVDEQIDTVSRTMLGMTIACARCHDHKFDPISQQDYYALAGIFASTRTMLNQDFVSKWMERELPSKRIDQLRRRHQQQIDALPKVENLVAEANQQLLAKLGVDQLPEKPEDQYPKETLERINKLRKQREELVKAMPAYESAMAVTEAEATNLPVHFRGNHLNKAPETTPRGVPRRLSDVAPMTSIPDDRSGRLQFAAWLTSPDHPLTARVMANRIWMWHFGQPLMQSPSNFGLQSEPPVHRELLDWIARRLMDDGWSLKRMHRLIMLSHAYQMTSRSNEYHTTDPANVYLWRQNRRRLEVEPLRDAIRWAGDSLDRRFDGPPEGKDSVRRTVYLSINRAALLDLFSTFDYVETANHIERRPVTIVPSQALFLMNHPLVHEQADILAQRVLEGEASIDQSLHRVWIRLHGRPPSDEEIQLSTQFIEQASSQFPEGPKRTQQALGSLCRTLIAGSLFSYVE